MELPKEIKSVLRKLKKSGFEGYVVGGCVRDFLSRAEPEDWDIATNARPSQIQKIFTKSYYKNRFFTVTVQTGSQDDRLREIDVTTYRLETQYADKRHPDKVTFAKTIEEDLSRRDFTVNAIAIGWEEPSERKKKLIDPFGGQRDIKNRIIKAVGTPEERFSEDALRMMRAVRFAVKLGRGWKIEDKTYQAIKNNSQLLKDISKERIRDELVKIVMSERAAEGIELLRKLNLLRYIIPELEESRGISQSKHHIYDCYEHSVRSLDYAAKRDFNQHVRLAALLHDIGKPKSKRGKGKEATFYGHEIVGARITARILNRLKFPKKDAEKIVKLVRYHLFYYNPEEVGKSSVRRLVRQVGSENMEELLQVRMADRIGSGVPKAEPYKLRHMKYVIDKVAQDPISTRMLKIDGHEVMKMMDIKEGPAVGQILDILLSEVLKEPKSNKRSFLRKMVKEMGGLPAKELSSAAFAARKYIEKIEIKRDQMTKKKYWVT